MPTMPFPFRGRFPPRPALLLVALLVSSSLAAAADPAGQHLYTKQSAPCHGPAVDRTDPGGAFDVGTAGPGEKFAPQQFSVRWEGSVLAPETGVYEFVVKCDHAVRLWVNDTKKPLIDAWVKSGNDTEFKGSIFLL